jgi:hypothetical protein
MSHEVCTTTKSSLLVYATNCATGIFHFFSSDALGDASDEFDNICSRLVATADKLNSLGIFFETS